MTHIKGSTLIEILLYIALYSILFVGYISFVFSLQNIIFEYQKKYGNIYIVYMVKEILTTYADRNSNLIVHEKELIVTSGKIINVEYMNKIFDTHIDDISFLKTGNTLKCILHIQHIEYIVNIHLL